MTIPILKKVGLDDSRPRLLEKLNYNFNRTGAGHLATGFDAVNYNREIGVDYNPTNRTVILDGTFKAYYEGILVPELTDGWISPPHAATLDKTYFLRYDGVQFIFDDQPFDIGNDLLIAVVQYGTLLKIVLRECHGIDMSGTTHRHWHYELGTGRRANGALFSSIVTGSTTPANRRPYVSGVRLADEDLESDVASLLTNSYCQRYLTGSTSNGTRTLLTAQTDIVKLNGNQPYYNQWTGSAWTDTLFPNNDYGALFVVAIPVGKNTDSQAVRYMWVQPQQTSGDLSVIQKLTTSDIKHGESSSLLAEYNFIGKIIIRYTANNWSITSIEELLGNRITQTSGAIGYGLATSTENGLMSSTDKVFSDVLNVLLDTTVDTLILSKGQLKFPATQVPSTDVNTLDDYEEGTWTPTYYGATSAGTTTYTTREGRYTKIGNVVHISLKLEVATATGTGFMRIGGFPLSIANTGGIVSTFHWGSAITALMGVIGNGNLFEVYLFAGGAIAEATIENDINIRFSGTFYI